MLRFTFTRKHWIVVLLLFLLLLLCMTLFVFCGSKQKLSESANGIFFTNKSSVSHILFNVNTFFSNDLINRIPRTLFPFILPVYILGRMRWEEKKNNNDDAFYHRKLKPCRIAYLQSLFKAYLWKSYEKLNHHMNCEIFYSSAIKRTKCDANKKNINLNKSNFVFT